jgi:hypothetical protein
MINISHNNRFIGDVDFRTETLIIWFMLEKIMCIKEVTQLADYKTPSSQIIVLLFWQKTYFDE